MGSTWQHVLVAAAAVLAAGWLVRSRLRERKSCADCALVEAMSRAPSNPPKADSSGSLEERAR
ncbi:MAG: hypothetical protein ACT4PE_01260 [Candidatus Eiseniibacteriota bacterium]